MSDRYFLAHKDGISALFGVLLHMGALCPKCGYGTRKTSKRWSRCKRCNERVENHELPPACPSNHADAARDGHANCPACGADIRQTL